MRMRRGWFLVIGLLTLTSSAFAADPGTGFEPLNPVSDQKAGSLLIFNIYTSSVAAPAAQNTKISITNTNDSSGIAIHLFFIDGASCSIADRYLCLTPNQTGLLLASEQDPGTSGYLVAIATDFNGLPALHNYLIGDEFVKFDTGHFASLGADAYTKINNVNVVSGDGTLAAAFLDGINLAGSYSAAARVLAVDNIGSAQSGNDTLLIFNRLGGNLHVAVTGAGSLFGILYDDAERPHSFNFVAGCHFRFRLNDAFPRTAPRFTQVIPAGQSGWMKFWAISDIALSGAVITRSTVAGASSFDGGHTLHALRLTSAVYTLPVFPPSC